MPHEQELNKVEKLSSLEKLPTLAWQQIILYLDIESEDQLRLSSKTNKKNIDAHRWNISFKDQIEFQQFIENKPSFYRFIKILPLSAEVTDYIFPFPKDYDPNNPFRFSFFSIIRTHFPNVEKIYLELKHLYMMPMLLNDPDFENSVQLIKRITTKVFTASSQEKLTLMEERYNEDISISDLDIYLCNSRLNQKVLTKFEKFIHLEQLSLSPAGGCHCDYEDLDHLLGQLTKLTHLELNLDADLTLDRTRMMSLDEVKTYNVMADPPKDPEKYAKEVIRYPLKEYPNITTLTLSGSHLPTSLLSHFASLKHLKIDSLYGISEDQHLPNKALQLLAELPNPEKLLSLQIPASIPLFSNGNPPTIDFRATSLSQLSLMTKLEKMIIDSPKDNWKNIKVINGECSPFISYPKHEAYLFPHVYQLTIHYNQYHTYHLGTLDIINKSFPNLINLTLIKEKEELNATTSESSINEDKLMDELREIKKNLWKNIKISIYGMNLSQDIKSSLPNAEFSENKLTISINSYPEEEVKNLTSRFFTDIPHSSNVTEIEPEKRQIKNPR